MFRLFVAGVAIILLIYVNYSVACGGYKLRINSIDNCGGDTQVISIDKNFTTILTPDCEVTSKGCVTSMGFTKAKVKYSIIKNGVVMLTGSPDMCAELDHKGEEAKTKLAMFGFPTACPVPEGRSCFEGDKKMNVTKYKNFLNLANGKMEIDAEIEHDTGKSCLKMKFELYK